MTAMIYQYENDIKNIRARMKELQSRTGVKLSIDELNQLRSRIELLETELYEMMYSLARLRRFQAPKPVTPSTAALMAKSAGDAAC